MAKKDSVADIVVDRLIKKINADKVLPWQKPFQAACMNWYKKNEYMGINKLLLGGGEFITKNQIEEYNGKKKRFWFESGTPTEIVVFYSKTEKTITQGELESLKKRDPNWHRVVKPTDKGWVKLSWFLRYYRVYNIKYIRDISAFEEKVKDTELGAKIKENKGVFKKVQREIKGKVKYQLALDAGGNPQLIDGVTWDDIEVLESKLGNSIIEEHTPADDIVNKYTSATGVRVAHGASGAYYTHVTDSVHLPDKPKFKDTEAYYRVLFHELIHSTGITERLNRKCFHDYHQGSKERSKEELIAEVGGLLLASEAGFREDTELAQNSENYVAGWCSWMKDNTNEVLQGMLAAEKAKNFILSGGNSINEGTERNIDNPESDQVEITGETEESSPVTDDVADKSPDAEPKPKKKSSGVKTIKTKNAAREFYNENLAVYFTADEDERKDILAGVTALELKHLYLVLTKEKLPASKKKLEVLLLLREQVEGTSKIG